MFTLWQQWQLRELNWIFSISLSCYRYSVKKVLATVKGRFPFWAMLLHTWYWSTYFLTRCPLFFLNRLFEKFRNILVSMSNIRLKFVYFVREMNLLITCNRYIRLCFLDVCGLPKNWFLKKSVSHIGKWVILDSKDVRIPGMCNKLSGTDPDALYN